MKCMGAICLLAAAFAVSASLAATRPTGTEWENEQWLSGGKLAPHAWMGHFPDAKSARGVLMEASPWHAFLDSETEWRFKWTKAPKDRPTDFYKVDYDISAWDVVKVPCSWQAVGIRASLERFGKPIYVNQSYDFTPPYPQNEGCWPKVTGHKLPKEWTFGPEDNPVGSYRRDFTVPEAWAGKRIHLQFDGVESFFYLWINGRYVGFSKNSRSPAEFDVTPYLLKDRNMLAVEVYSHCDGSYLEAQDMFRLSGIFRHVRLFAVPHQSLADATVETEPVSASVYDGDWRVKVLAEFRSDVRSVNPGYIIAARVFDGDGREVAVRGQAEGTTDHRDINTPESANGNYSLVRLGFAVAQPKTWSAEEPNLYTLVLELRAPDGKTVIDAAGFQLGFREVGIRRAADPSNNVFLFNGKPIKVKGVNRGECHPKYGHHVPDADLMRDLELIKRCNMNHIRCSHFPQGELFYYLCNKHGIYLMDEANLESHGYRYGALSLSHPEEWRTAHVDRVRAMYEWDKNNPSVIFWSLGNEAGPGRNFHECACYLKGRDTKRPVNWERNNSLADIGSRQYPQLQWVKDVAAGTNTVMYPYHINEYLHERLCSARDTKSYQDAIESSDRIIGAAVWDFADQSLLTRSAKGAWVDGWGGDWHEEPTEGDGILEGLVRADRTPEPSYFVTKYAYQPFAFAVENGMLRVTSKFFFVDSANYRFTWEPLRDGESCGAERRLDLGGPLAPRESRLIDLPDGGEDIVFRVYQVEGRDLIPAGYQVAEEQLAVRESPLPQPERVPPPETFAAGGWAFSRETGLPEGIGMTLDAFSYPIRDEAASYVGPGPDGVYRECLKEGLRNLRPTEVSFTEPVKRDEGWTFTTVQTWRGVVREDCTDVTLPRVKLIELGPTTESNATIRAENQWTVRGDGSLLLRSAFAYRGRPLDVKTGGNHPAFWKIIPTLGWKFKLSSVGSVEYRGCGPFENYPTTKAAAFSRVWRVGSVTDMGFSYTRPQDFGHREDVRYVKLDGLEVRAVDRPFSMRVTPWSPTELLLADHPSDLPTATKTHLSVYGSDKTMLSILLMR